MTSSITPVAASGSTDQLQTKKTMGQEDFLNLLVTQMRYQDPFKPMENSEFTAQLAQFSSLDQLFAINKGLVGLTGSQQTSGNAQAVGFIGKEVRASGNLLSLQADRSSDIGFNLGKGASEIQIRILNEEGGVVRTLVEGSQSAGQHQITWDGRDNQGRRMAPGAYHFDVAARDGSGGTVTVSPYVAGIVSGVTYEADGTYLVIGSLRVPIQQVTEVKEAK